MNHHNYCHYTPPTKPLYPLQSNGPVVQHEQLHRVATSTQFFLRNGVAAQQQQQQQQQQQSRAGDTITQSFLRTASSSSRDNNNSKFPGRIFSPFTFANFNGSNTSHGIQNNTQRFRRTTDMRPTTRMNLPINALMSTIVESGKGKVKVHQKPKLKRVAHKKSMYRKKNRNKIRPDKQSLCWEGSRFPLEIYCLLQYSGSDGYNDVISWTDQGCAFAIHNPVRFAKGLMVECFGGRFGSLQEFVTTLYDWGFTKVVCDGRLIFVHPYLLQGNISLLSQIKRRYLPKPQIIHPPPTAAAAAAAAISTFPLPAVANDAEYESDSSESEFEINPSPINQHLTIAAAAAAATAISTFPLPAVANDAEYESDLSESEFAINHSMKVNASAASAVFSHNNCTHVTNEAEYDNDLRKPECETDFSTRDNASAPLAVVSYNNDNTCDKRLIFVHPHLSRGNISLLSQIKRRDLPKPKIIHPPPTAAAAISKIPLPTVTNETEYESDYSDDSLIF